MNINKKLQTKNSNDLGHRVTSFARGLVNPIWPSAALRRENMRTNLIQGYDTIYRRPEVIGTLLASYAAYVAIQHDERVFTGMLIAWGIDAAYEIFVKPTLDKLEFDLDSVFRYAKIDRNK